MNNTDETLRLTRRELLAGSAVTAAALATQPVAAQAKPELEPTAPPGHDRKAPAFRRVHLDK
jgi:hypothetical protein